MKSQIFFKQSSRKLRSSKEIPEWLKSYPGYRDQIRLIRESLGMTRKQLGNLVGRSHITIQNIESGRARPKITTLKKIAEAFDADLKIFLIPQKTLEEILDEKALRMAGKIVDIDSASSSLEAQTPTDETKADQVESLKKEILEKRRRSLWD